MSDFALLTIAVSAVWIAITLSVAGNVLVDIRDTLKWIERK